MSDIKNKFPINLTDKKYSKISDLLIKLYDNDIPLSKIIKSIKAFATKTDNIELQSFCEHELNGWEESPSENDYDKLKYRFMLVYCIDETSVFNIHEECNKNKVNLNEYIITENNKFFPHRCFIPLPIAKIEKKQEMPPGNLISGTYYYPDIKNIEKQILYFANNDSYKLLIKSIRQECINKIINLLPDFIPNIH